MMNHSAAAIAEASIWIVIVVFALIMQVMPLLLILTLFNIAVGVSSTAMLIIIPIALFGIIFVACSIAEKRRKDKLPAPRPVNYVQQLQSKNALRHSAACMLPYLRRNRFNRHF
tara:strand:+ start:115 stop:456 length:342 start_codon:yes stop_codon:yes gene_type:complete